MSIACRALRAQLHMNPFSHEMMSGRAPLATTDAVPALGIHGIRFQGATLANGELLCFMETPNDGSRMPPLPINPLASAIAGFPIAGDCLVSAATARLAGDRHPSAWSLSLARFERLAAEQCEQRAVLQPETQHLQARRREGAVGAHVHEVAVLVGEAAIGEPRSALLGRGCVRRWSVSAMKT